MAGVVETVGDGVTRFRVGDRVISNFLPEWVDGKAGATAREPSYRTLGGRCPGVLSEYVIFSEERFTAAPASLDDPHASTLPVAGLTAWFRSWSRATGKRVRPCSSLVGAALRSSPCRLLWRRVQRSL